jgi:aspartate aminotransferase-like enzyme
MKCKEGGNLQGMTMMEITRISTMGKYRRVVTKETLFALDDLFERRGEV